MSEFGIKRRQNMPISALEILRDAEAISREGVKSAVVLLPVATHRIGCLHGLIEFDSMLPTRQDCLTLLKQSSDAHRAFRAERSIAYDPFDIFWNNPDEPRHTKLLGYFIDPRAEHGCGLFLLRGFLSVLEVLNPGLPVDDHCAVGCEVRCENRRSIDLLIRRNRADGRYVIIIENKINGAADQGQQLQAYFDEMLRNGFSRDEVHVCYLTLRGGSPTADSLGTVDRLSLASFKSQIAPWLNNVLDNRSNWPLGMAGDMRDNLDRKSVV
jgi:hypothetical protein